MAPRISKIFLLIFHLCAALNLIFSFTNGVEWDGPYRLQVQVPKSWRNKPIEFFNKVTVHHSHIFQNTSNLKTVTEKLLEEKKKQKMFRKYCWKVVKPNFKKWRKIWTYPLNKARLQFKKKKKKLKNLVTHQRKWLIYYVWNENW